MVARLVAIVVSAISVVLLASGEILGFVDTFSSVIVVAVFVVRVVSEVITKLFWESRKGSCDR